MKPLFDSSEWDFPGIMRAWEEIEKIATDEFHLNWYTPQIEIVSSEQMLDLYSSVGLPVYYKHWSFGKRFITDQRTYQAGMNNLALELVINSSPLITYLMEDNTSTMQALVLAHSIAGHGHFFKNNYLFRERTDPESIVDYLIFAQNYIKKCEERHGFEEVELFLDSCHSIANYGIDKYRRPAKLSVEKEKRRQEELEEERQRQVNELWSTLPKATEPLSEKKVTFPEEPQENLMYFIEKNAPDLETWQRELIRIVRKISSYFRPQMLTKTENEGFACTVHYQIMYRLWEKGLLTDGNMEEFLISHTNVVSQPDFDHKYYSGINPYALGYGIFSDLKRICETPTSEDREWFPELIHKNWFDVVLDAVENYRDESFIRQFMSPHFIRKWKFFKIDDEANSDTYQVDRIHNERGYRMIRDELANHYDPSFNEPDIQVIDVDLRGDRTLYLRHVRRNHIPLEAESAEEVMKHVARLWGYAVKLQSYDPIDNRIIKTFDAKKI